MNDKIVFIIGVVFGAVIGSLCTFVMFMGLAMAGVLR